MSHGDQEATSAADVFDLLWESLADVLGTAATATLVRRALAQVASRTAPAGPGPAGTEPVVVTRTGPNYEYRLPATWTRAGNEEAVVALRRVAAALRGLLIELTGPVVVRRLGRHAVFHEHGIDFSDEAPT